MLKLGQAGVAAAVAVVAVAAVAGGAVGTPVAVDSLADQEPGDPLYGLERAGESIKEATFAGGQGWQLGRANERVSELKKIKERKVSSNHIGLLNEAENRLDKGIKMSKDNKGLERAQNAVRKHIRVLENVKNKVDNEAKPAIENAMVRSRVQEKAIEEVQDNLQREFGQGELPQGLLKQKLENKLISVENVIKILQDRQLPPGIFKEVMENRDISFDNLEGLMENRKLSPGIVKNILENKEVSLDHIKDFLEGKELPRGIVKNILKDKGMNTENIRNFLDELDVPGNGGPNGSENGSDNNNAGPPGDAGPPDE